MSKREEILVALFAVLEGVDPAITRNAALGDFDGDGVFRTLRDGGIETTEEFFNPSIYEFTMTPTIVLALSKADEVDDDVDALVDDRVGDFVDAIEGIDDNLGGLVTAIRVQPADFAPREIFGTPDKKGVSIDIELDFWSEHSSG